MIFNSKEHWQYDVKIAANQLGPFYKAILKEGGKFNGQVLVGANTMLNDGEIIITTSFRNIGALYKYMENLKK